MIGFPTDGVLQTAKWDTTPCMLDSAGGLILNEKKRAVELTPRRELASKYQKEIFDRDSTMPHHSSTGNIQQPCLENPAGEGIARGPADYIAAAEGVEHWSRGTETSTILKLPFYARRMRDHAYGLPAGTLSKRFFALAEPEKNLIRRPPDKSIYRGYVGVGHEKVRERICIKESFDSGSPDEDEQPNIWPSEELLPGYREFMEMFFQECSKLAQQLLDALSLALNLSPADSLVQSHVTSSFTMSMLHYPALPTKCLLSGTHTRIPAHSDFGTLTLLFQDSVGGLEIAEPGSANTETSAGFEKEGRFRKVEPKPGTVVVNLGYLLMRWSNGRWKNTVHRVVEPPNSESGEDEMAPARYSIPFFVSPDSATVVEALPGCWSEEVPKRWKPISAGDYIRRKRGAAYV